MSRLHEVPHTPYYGSIDATPLWIWLFAEAVQWTGEQALFADLLPNARRALDWIERYGDLDGDGFVEYRSEKRGSGGIANQVWKDSFDSLNHADGAKVEGPIAAVEVQGYVFAAYTALAETARVFGESALTRELERKAEALRERVESAFWLEPEGFYAQALDRTKTPVRALSSNPGHLLMSGLPAPDRAARMIARFGEADFATGWGVRTLSANAVTYNPMSYHNGSVWPHDNSLIGAGFYRYGDRDAGHALTTALFDAAAIAPLRRLPELYCGFARTLTDHIDCPVAYPVSCTPQAWAAGALPLLLRAMLGIEVDLANKMLVVNPSLPLWLNTVIIDDLRVLGMRGSLTFRRDGDRVICEPTGLPVRQS
jgi:glycogen debranching enzyme